MSEIKLGSFERVPASDGAPQFYIVTFHAWLPADDHGQRSNINGSVRPDVPWQTTSEAFEPEVMKAVQEFLRKAAAAFAPA